MDTTPEGPYFHADETTYLAPGNMVERINAGLRAAGFPEERRPPELAAIIFRSLARRYAAVVGELGRLSGKSIKRICIVGGGVKNEALEPIDGVVNAGRGCTRSERIYRGREYRRANRRSGKKRFARSNPVDQLQIKVQAAFVDCRGENGSPPQLRGGVAMTFSSTV